MVVVVVVAVVVLLVVVSSSGRRRRRSGSCNRRSNRRRSSSSRSSRSSRSSSSRRRSSSSSLSQSNSERSMKRWLDRTPAWGFDSQATRVYEEDFRCSDRQEGSSANQDSFSGVRFITVPYFFGDRKGTLIQSTSHELLACRLKGDTVP